MLRTKNIFSTTLISLLLFIPAGFTHAGVIDELKEKISAHGQKISELEAEIRSYRKRLSETDAEAKTLESAIQQLEYTEQKLATDLSVTEQRIQKTSLTIDKLELDIADKEARIRQNTKALSSAVRRLHELESRSLVEILFSHPTISSFWNSVVQLNRFQNSVRASVGELVALKSGLVDTREDLLAEQDNLYALRGRLSDQRHIVAENQKEKESLLADTKNKEANYKQLLEDRLRKKEALEREIREFEERLRVEIDPDSLPTVRPGVFSWPTEDVTITQFFGNTPFASKNPQVYNRQGHNGVDFRASRGTVITSVAGGTVRDVGDTDRQCHGVSYGKWVLVDHENGLSSLYAHLDLIKVAPGEKVERGDLVGYSGNTGFTTGPHLHLGAYATKAVSVVNKKSRVCGTNLTLPVAPTNGYLNPLSYLPSLP